MLLTSVGDSLEDQTLDARSRLHADGSQGQIAVVAIDPKTFDPPNDEVWPFKRSRHAKVIDELRRAGAKTVVYDVQFTEPTENKEDLALFDAVSRKPGTVLAATEVDEGGDTKVLGGSENTDAAKALVGMANLPTDTGGVIRKYYEQVGGLPSLAVQAVKSATGKVPTRFHDGEAWIDYQGVPESFPTLSFIDVEKGRFDPADVRGKIVVVGASAPSLQDRHATPMSHELMAGPEVQANAIWTALNDNPLAPAPLWLGIVIVLLGGLAPAVLAARARLVLAVAGALVLAAVYALIVVLRVGRRAHPPAHRAADARSPSRRSPRSSRPTRWRTGSARASRSSTRCSRSASANAPPSCAPRSWTSCTGSARRPRRATARPACTSSASATSRARSASRTGCR